MRPDGDIANINGMKLSARNMDQDPHPTVHCSQLKMTGWWMKGCARVNINGLYLGPGMVVINVITGVHKTVTRQHK